MKKNFLIVLFAMIFSVSFSQTETTKQTIIPISIYTLNYESSLENIYYTVNNELNFKKYKFTTLSFQDFDRNKLDLSSLFSKNYLAFIEQDMKIHRDKYLSKSFLLKNDPTRWSICNFIPQNHPN